MKLLSGKELSEFIKQRQVKQVRSLRQSSHIQPKLAIIRTNPDPVVNSYMKLKQAYGEDIGIEVDIHNVSQAETVKCINKLNQDKTIHGIIVQIPLPDPSKTDEILNSVSPLKDVDALGKEAVYDPATPMAINWLLAGYNVDLRNKKIVIVGKGRLVGKPLAKIWHNSGYIVKAFDRSVKNLTNELKIADVIVSATGVPGLINKDMIKEDAVIVDAGVATDSNGLVGDVAIEVRDLPSITITPIKGGVGPLTVCALFENVIRAFKENLSR